MIHFLGNLGIDLHLLLAQVVNLCVLLVVLTKLVYEPIIARIESDEALLHEAAKETAALKKEREETAAARRIILERAQDHAQHLIREADRIAEDLHERARVEAQTEKDAVIVQIRERLKNLEHDTI